MQKIDNIEIKNFKSIRHQKIEGCKRINVFVGAPNVGKSNILEALSLMCFENNRSGLLKDFCRFDLLINIFNDGDSAKDAEIICRNKKYSLKYKNESHLTFQVEDTNSVSTKILGKTPVLNNLKFDHHGQPTLISDNTEISEISPVKKYQFKIGSSINSKNDAKTLESPFGRNLALVLRHNKDVRQECGELFDIYNLKLIFDKDDNIVVQKKLDEFTAFQFSVSQIADTLQRLIFHKAAIASNNNAVLLFEEPEAQMFPPYISKFTGDMVYNENNNQFFITTHSPFVLNDLLDNAESEDLAIYVVSYKNDTGETKINRMSDLDKREAYQFGYDFFMNINQFIPQETNG